MTTAMLDIGQQVNTLLEKGEGANAVNQLIQTATLYTLLAQEDLTSAIGPEK